jgi:hypothetical protein
MTYIRVKWKHSSPTEPILLYSDLESGVSQIQVQFETLRPSGSGMVQAKQGRTHRNRTVLVAISRTRQLAASTIAESWGTVEGQDYSGHAFDEMRNRGLVPSVVENATRTSPGLLSISMRRITSRWSSTKTER